MGKAQFARTFFARGWPVLSLLPHTYSLICIKTVAGTHEGPLGAKEQMVMDLFCLGGWEVLSLLSANTTTLIAVELPKWVSLGDAQIKRLRRGYGGSLLCWSAKACIPLDAARERSGDAFLCARLGWEMKTGGSPAALHALAQAVNALPEPAQKRQGIPSG
jgi:hypothetical protein